MGLVTEGKIKLIVRIAQFTIVKSNIGPIHAQGQLVAKRPYDSNVGLSNTHDV